MADASYAPHPQLHQARMLLLQSQTRQAVEAVVCYLEEVDRERQDRNDVPPTGGFETYGDEEARERRVRAIIRRTQEREAAKRKATELGINEGVEGHLREKREAQLVGRVTMPTMFDGDQDAARRGLAEAEAADNEELWKGVPPRKPTFVTRLLRALGVEREA